MIRGAAELYGAQRNKLIITNYELDNIERNS